jgi:hypothetical protein
MLVGTRSSMRCTEPLNMPVEAMPPAVSQMSAICEVARTAIVRK